MHDFQYCLSYLLNTGLVKNNVECILILLWFSADLTDFFADLGADIQLKNVLSFLFLSGSVYLAIFTYSYLSNKRSSTIILYEKIFQALRS